MVERQLVHPVPSYPRMPPISETLYPDDDFETGGWFPTPLNAEIDETTPFDSTAVSTFNGSFGAFLALCSDDGPQDPENFTVDLPDFAVAPTGSETFTYEVRVERLDTVGSGHTVELDIEFLAGAVLIASRTGITLSTTEVGYVDTLSPTEVGNLLTEGTNLMRIRVTCIGCVSGIDDEADGRVTMARLIVA